MNNKVQSLMLDVQDEPHSNGIYTLYDKRFSQHILFFFLWALFTSICDAFIYLYLYQSFSIYLNIWFFIFSFFIITSSCIITFFIKNNKKISYIYIHLCYQLLCLVLGCLLGIGVYLINYELSLKVTIATPFNSFMLSSFLLSFCYVIGINFLSQKFSYFIAIFIPSALSLFCIPIFFPSNTDVFYISVFIIWFSLLFFSAYISHRIYKNLEVLNLKNIQLYQQAQDHLVESQTLQLRLQDEVNKSREIKNELQLNNQLLEQKVKERILDFQQINDRLENHQANLAFAHETAGLHSWVWDIEKRTFEIIKARNESEFQHIVLKYDGANEIIHPDDITNYKTQLRKHLKGQTDRFEVIYRVKKNQQWFWIQDTGKVIARNEKNQPLKMVGIHRNIQNEKTYQEQLKLAASVFSQVAEGIFVLDSNLCYLEVNPYFEKLLNYKLSDIVGRHLFDITVNKGKFTQESYTNITRALLQAGEFDSELSVEFTSGKNLTLWIHINAIYDEKNKLVNYVGIIADLTYRRKQEQRLSYLKNYNILTDLPNRFYFQQQLQHYLNHHSTTYQHFAVIRINIDRFKSFNEFLSQKDGDELLKQLSERLRLNYAHADLIAYLSNDDFAIIQNVEGHSIPIKHLTQSILNVCKQPFHIHGQEQTISVSIGVALFPEHGFQLDSLTGHAEFALNEAKRLGGNTVQFYSNTQTTPHNHGVNLENELRKAIKNKTLSVHFQPKICMRTSRIYGFEALIRWEHETLGYVAPDIFIPLAEEANLISDISSIVLKETCKQIQIWQKLGFDHLRVSINIAAQQIHRGQLLKEIDYALEKYEVSGDMLELELTESSLIDKSKQVDQFLLELKERHISISLDDFGTGYSSLAYLTSYPIDTLKIDKAFISKIGQEKDEAIVNAIIAMATAIGIDLVAEGVETEEQVRFLEKHGCYILQGFYFSKALSASESTQYLQDHKLIPFK